MIAIEKKAQRNSIQMYLYLFLRYLYIIKKTQEIPYILKRIILSLKDLINIAKNAMDKEYNFFNNFNSFFFRFNHHFITINYKKYKYQLHLLNCNFLSCYYSFWTSSRNIKLCLIIAFRIRFNKESNYNSYDPRLHEFPACEFKCDTSPLEVDISLYGPFICP